MPDNVNNALAEATDRLLRPLVKIMLQQGFTYSNFASIARAAFVKCAIRDYAEGTSAKSIDSVSKLTGISVEEVTQLAARKFQTDNDLSDEQNLFGRILHAWHNDREFVGPYGFPLDLPLEGGEFNFTILATRHTPEVLPAALLKGLGRIGAVREVGKNIWQPTVRELIDPTLSPDNIRRMGKLVEALISTLENNTRENRASTDLFERTMFVDVPLTEAQLLGFQEYLKAIGGQFLQRVDAYAAIDLRKEVPVKVGDIAEIRAGLQCFLFVDSDEIELS